MKANTLTIITRLFLWLWLVSFSLNSLAALNQTASTEETPAVEKVRLQLKWFNQFQFAGYYAAVEQGYYVAEGLDVEIIERQLDKSVVKQVISGAANYGVGDSGLLSQFVQGEPVTALAAIFQHNPLVLFTRQDSGIISPYEMVNKRIMLDTLSANEAPLRAMLTAAKITDKNFTLLQQSNDYSLLTQGKVDVISGYMTDQRYYFKQQGVKINVVNPQNYGIDFYGDILFTSQQELRDHPQRTNKFLRASLKGWQYALAHPEELIQIIHQKYKSRLSLKHLRFEAAETRKLIASDVVPLGLIDLNRLKAIVQLQTPADLNKTISDNDLSAFIYQQKNSLISLTEQEQAWLNTHPVITVGIDSDYAPYESIDGEGHYVGMVAGYLQLIEKKLGIQFEIHGNKTWSETFNMAMRGELDMLSAAAQTPERLNHFTFVKPFKSAPVVIIDNGGGGFIGKLDNLNNKRVAVEKDYFMEELLTTQYPNISLTLVNSTKDALNLVADEKVDAYVGDAGTTNYVIKKEGLLSLRFSGQTPYTSEQSIAVYRGNVELASIMDKAMAAITLEESDAIFNYSLGLQIEQGINTKTLVNYALIIVVVFLLFFVWILKLRKQINLRKQAEKVAIQAQRDTQNVLMAATEVSIIETDRNGLISMFNSGAERMLGYSAVEMIGHTTLTLIHLDKEVIQRAQQLSHELGYKVSGFDVFVTKTALDGAERREWTYVCKNGTHITVSLVMTVVCSSEGDIIGYLGIAQNISTQKLLEYNLMQEVERQKKLVHQMPGIIYQYQLLPDGRACFPYASDGIREIYEVSPEQVRTDATAVHDVFHPDDYDRIEKSIKVSATTMRLWEIEYRVILPIKGVRWLSGSARPELLNDGSILWHGFITDITVRKETEQASLTTSQLLDQSQQIAKVGGWQLDIVTGDLFWTDETYRLHDTSPEKFNPTLDAGLSYFLPASHELISQALDAAINQGTDYDLELETYTAQGRKIDVRTTCTVTQHDGKTVKLTGIFQDITDQKNAQRELERMAHYDVLTNLPNRTLLADRLNQAMIQCQRHQQLLAVTFLDLDGFKVINDNYGHDVGDKLLVALSQRMKKALREGDTIARFGGDEFVIVLADLAATEDCNPILDRLLKAAADPVNLGDAIIQVSASIGIAIYPQDNVDADQLMRHADQAMYLAKQAGKNCYRFFDTARDEAVNIQRRSLGDIHSALERREFVLHYQPKVNMQTDEVIGVEALIRWQHPVRGLVPPLDFLPIIEGHAISLELGEWVIDMALSQISQWQNMGFTLPISVNISAYQLQQTNIVERLAALLAAHPDVEPQHLELEVLETSALDDVKQVSTIMNACMALGVKFALDDFGTGYSSLTYLRRLPAHLIKIDQTFVRDMLEDVDDLAIVEGVVALAKSFKRKVIAEGVETLQHGTTLLQLGCELAQGYGIAKPMAAEHIPAWISQWKSHRPWRS